MKSRPTILAAICCLPIVFGCANRASDEAAQIAAAGSRYMAAGQFSDAYSKFQQAAELRPEVAEYHVGAGMAAAKLGKKEEAAKQYGGAEQILARQAQHDPERVDDEAMVLVLLGRTADATGELKAGAKRFPNSRKLERLASDPASFIAGLRPYSVGSVESNGAANGSQPTRPETNRTSSAAGPRR